MQTPNETAGKRRQKELNDLREHFHSYDAHWLNMQSSTSATPLSVVRIRKPLFDFWGCDDLSLNINALDDFQSKIVKLFIDDDNAILDTNGTVPLTPRHLDAIRSADALVRISMDSANPATEGRLRPRHGVAEDMFGAICANLALLIREGISVSVHTVVTRVNEAELMAQGEWLQELGVRGWHLYGLLRNGRATQRYQELFVSHDRLIMLRDALRQRYPHMSISCSAGEKEAEDTAALIVDSSGRFFVQQPDCAPVYTGRDPNRPTAEEIAAHLNVESYVRNYYSAGIS